jgi:hypothetical protein
MFGLILTRSWEKKSNVISITLWGEKLQVSWAVGGRERVELETALGTDHSSLGEG